MSKEYKRKHRLSKDIDKEINKIVKDKSQATTKDYILTTIWILLTSPYILILIILNITLNKEWTMKLWNSYMDWSDRILEKL